MCGRYQFTAEQSAEILQIIQEVQDKCGDKAAEAIRQGEVVPGCKMPVLLGSDEGPTPELMLMCLKEATTNHATTAIPAIP